MDAVSFTHSTIGEIKGRPSEGATQFLGLQYATLVDRFAPPVLKQYDANTTIDATKIGPSVLVHAEHGADFEQKLFQHDLVYDRSAYRMSDLEGLNLNVTLPAGLNADRKLPVLAFIHGGGYNVGSSNFPQYDQARLVKLSVEKEEPIIAVSLNYRLNAPGFLTSEEMRNAGYKPNNALRDQRTALLWIQRYISGFGGDPSQVTLVGESAGAVSVSFHLQSKEALFRRCMLMSGSSLLFPPVPAIFAETSYTNATKALGLESASPAERIQALNTMEGKALCSKILFGGISLMPVLDDDIITSSPTFRDLAFEPPSWCEAVIIGDCQFDGSIQSLRLGGRKAGIASAFCSSIISSLGQVLASKLLSSYEVDPNTSDDEAFLHVLQFASDVQFYSPTLTFAETLSKKMEVYMYRFNVPNPWEGPWKGHAVHIQDLMWLFQNLNEFLEKPQRKQAREFAKGVISFVNGKEAWQAWSGGKEVAKVFGSEGDVEVGRDEAPGNGRRAITHELAQEAGGWDVLSDALDAFMRAPPSS